MNKMKSIAVWILIAVLVLTALAGGYYIFVRKPLLEAQKAVQDAADIYENEYAEYLKAVDAYNSKADRVRAAASELAEAHKALRKVISDDMPYSPVMIEEAEVLIRDQEKLIAHLPEHEIPVSKATLPSGIRREGDPAEDSAAEDTQGDASGAAGDAAGTADGSAGGAGNGAAGSADGSADGSAGSAGNGAAGDVAGTADGSASGLSGAGWSAQKGGRLIFSGNEKPEELLAVAAMLSEKTEIIRLETQDVKERTQNLEIPDFSDEVDAALTWQNKLKNSIYDPFENLIITFSGTEPNGTVGIARKSDSGINARYDFVVEETSKLCNGDEILVTVKPVQNMTEEELNEELAREYGKAIASFSKTFTVEGLSYYISGADDLSADAFSKMQTKAEESLQAYAEKNWDQDVRIEEMTYIGNYFLERKVTNQGFYQDGAKNQLVLLYRVHSVIDLSNKGKDYQQEVDFIYTITYRNVINLADGTCAVDYNKFSEPDETFKIDTGVKSGLFKRFKYTFKGYSDLDAAFNRIVASQNDHYTYTADVKE